MVREKMKARANELTTADGGWLISGELTRPDWWKERFVNDINRRAYITNSYIKKFNRSRIVDKEP